MGEYIPNNLHKGVNSWDMCIVFTAIKNQDMGLHAVIKCKLNSFHICYLRKFLGITCRDKVPNVDILRHCGMVNLQIILKQCRLYWLNHVFCMNTDCLLQQILCGELADVKHNRGHPRQQFADACWCNLKLRDCCQMGDDYIKMQALEAANAWVQSTLQNKRVEKSPKRWEVRQHARQTTSFSRSAEGSASAILVWQPLAANINVNRLSARMTNATERIKYSYIILNRSVWPIFNTRWNI